jgi:hypothetical protein
MGRKKKQKKQRIIDAGEWKEEEFVQAAEYFNYTIPNQLRNWRRFFASQESFLKAADEWLEAKINGVPWPTIEDDIDKGLMRERSRNPMIPAQKWNWYDEYEEQEWQYNTTPHTWKGPFFRRAPSLPAKPAIEAPSGLAGVDLATVF